MAGVFVEIGSCDFDNYEILLLDGWTGYFIEPVTEYIDSLKLKIQKLSQERNKNLKAFFSCCAISNYDGAGKIRYMPSNSGDWWVKGLGHVSGFKNNGIEMRDNFAGNSKTIQSNFLTLDSYFSMMKINSVDILKVDVEGHELKVFENYSWRIKPRHIKIEYTFVGLDPIVQLLKQQNYECMFDSEDVFGTLKD